MTSDVVLLAAKHDVVTKIVKCLRQTVCTSMGKSWLLAIDEAVNECLFLHFDANANYAFVQTRFCRDSISHAPETPRFPNAASCT